MTFQELCELITGLNIQSLIFFLGAMWWFTRHLHKELHDVVQELRSVNLRVARLEGTVYGGPNYQKDILEKERK